jgi:hypothetical protein
LEDSQKVAEDGASAEKKRRQNKGNIQSLCPSGFAPAFGRAVAPFGVAFYGTRERVPFRFVNGPRAFSLRLISKGKGATATADPPTSAKDDNKKQMRGQKQKQGKNKAKSKMRGFFPFRQAQGQNDNLKLDHDNFKT